jgi:hypothetical protein
VGVVRAEVAGSALFVFICCSHFRMYAQIVSERDVADNLGRICFEKMKLYESIKSGCVSSKG